MEPKIPDPEISEPEESEQLSELVVASEDIEETKEAEETEKAILRRQRRREELTQLREVVAEDLEQLAQLHGDGVYQQASKAPAGVLQRLRSRARAQGLSGRLRDLRGVLAEVLQGKDCDVSTRSATPTWSKTLDWERLSTEQQQQLNLAMEQEGFMTEEAQAHYATEEGWGLYQRRLAQLALQLGVVS